MQLRKKWNGYGKEYNVNDKLQFDGEYKNGIKWCGKVIEYNSDDKLIFEGNYLNGKKWSGKERKYLVNLVEVFKIQS